MPALLNDTLGNIVPLMYIHRAVLCAENHVSEWTADYWHYSCDMWDCSRLDNRLQIRTVHMFLYIWIHLCSSSRKNFMDTTIVLLLILWFISIIINGGSYSRFFFTMAWCHHVLLRAVPVWQQCDEEWERKRAREREREREREWTNSGIEWEIEWKRL